VTIDVWMRHPTVRFSQHDMFDSLRRWTGQQALTEELPIAVIVPTPNQGQLPRPGCVSGLL